MPNPIAHPAASIPFARSGLVFSALVIGSVAPDLGYFVELPNTFFMYTAPGLILFDVPAGLLVLWLFHALVKWPLLSILPDGLQCRLFKVAQGFSFGSLRHFGVVLLSLLVGSLTHIVWDSFTHVDGWVVEQFAFLRETIGGVPLYSILQNLSTLVGIGLLTYWFIRWFPTAPRSDQRPARFSRRLQAILLGIAAVALVASETGLIYWGVRTGTAAMHRHFLAFSMVVSASFVLALFLGGYCVVWMIVFHRTIPRAG